MIRQVAILVGFALGVAACNTLLGWNDLKKVDDLPRDAALGSPKEEGGVGRDATVMGSDAAVGPDGDVPSDVFCANTVLCLRFDGIDSAPGVRNIKGGATVDPVAGDAVSLPAALVAKAPSGDYAGMQWSVTPKFAASSVLTFRMSFKVTSVGTVTGLPTIGYVRVGGDAQLNIAVKPTTNEILLIWTDLTGREQSRTKNVATWSPNTWATLSFAISSTGVALTPNGPILAAPESAPIGEIGMALGITAYYASDAPLLTTLIDDVAMTLQ